MITSQDLHEEFDAVLLCLGATWPRDLPINNRQLEGIHFAMSFLETWQKKQMGNSIDHLTLSAKDKDVIVIGGGDTGCDCIGTSLRQVGLRVNVCVSVSLYSLFIWKHQISPSPFVLVLACDW